MKKGRFIFLVTAAILMAPPLGVVLIWLLFFIVSLFIETGAGNLEDLLGFTGLSYLFGFIPALVTCLTAARIVYKGKAVSIGKMYLLCLFLSLLNLLISTFFLPFEAPLWALMIAFPVAIIINMTLGFFSIYYLSKKLLPWAGTSLIEPAKTSTP